MLKPVISSPVRWVCWKGPSHTRVLALPPSRSAFSHRSVPPSINKDTLKHVLQLKFRFNIRSLMYLFEREYGAVLWEAKPKLGASIKGRPIVVLSVVRGSSPGPVLSRRHLELFQATEVANLVLQPCLHLLLTQPTFKTRKPVNEGFKRGEDLILCSYLDEEPKGDWEGEPFLELLGGEEEGVGLGVGASPKSRGAANRLRFAAPLGSWGPGRWGEKARSEGSLLFSVAHDILFFFR